MKGVYVVRRKHGTSVYLSYSPPGEPRVRELFETVARGVNFDTELRAAKRRAGMVIHKRRAAIVEGTHQLAPRRSMTLSEFVEKHYADDLRQRRGGGLRTAEKEIQRLTTGPVGRALGEVRLADLNEWKLRGYIRDRREAGVSPGAINRDLTRLSDLWNTARKRKLVSGANPCHDVGLLDEPEFKARFLEPEDVARLLPALHPEVRRLVEVAINTGIRLGALLGLRWRDVDLRRDLVMVPDSLSKSREAYFVPLNRRTRTILDEVRSRGAHVGEGDFVFCKGDGQPRKSVRTAWQAGCRRAGLEGLRFHDLRHTAASWIVMKGGSLYDVQAHLGHRSPAMSQRYAHLSADHRRWVADLIVTDPAAIAVTDLSRVRAEQSSA